jgi:hypothetical protein
MNISSFDIILLFILAIAVSMIIGYNIIHIIDKKISNVNINIPPIHIPKPCVTVRIDEKGNKHDVRIEKKYKMSKLDNINNTSNKQKMANVEPFGNYAGAEFD